MNGYSWPAGSEVTIHLQLTRPPVVLQDGSSSWNASAANALALWNQHLATISLVQGPGSGPAGADGANSVFFSSNIYGDPFPAGVLAVTLNYSQAAGVFTETDVIFNNNLQWNSYQGPIQWGPVPTYDLRRVALHEFGHVLGLGHPDEQGQGVIAIMNSSIGDLAYLADDDIAGATELYGKPVLSAFLGSDFRYQVNPQGGLTIFRAVGLPHGLSINPSTGLISGIPTLSGKYNVEVTASDSSRTVTVFVQITVTAPPPPAAGELIKKFDFLVERAVADPVRPRVYATVPATNSVAVIDTNTLSVTNIPIGPRPIGLAVSADGSKLWVANSGSASAAIGVIDLNTLQVLPSLPAPYLPYDVEEGLNQRLYVTPYSWNFIGTGTSTGMMQIDGSTGTHLGFLGGFEVEPWGLVEISPDRRTLYYATRGSAFVKRFDVSTTSGSLLQRVRWGGNMQDLKVSHDGRWLIFSDGGGNDSASNTFKLSAADLSAVPGKFSVGPYPGAVAFSGDDLILYHGLQHQGKVNVFDATTFSLLSEIRITPSATGWTTRDMVVDGTGAFLFVATRFGDQGDLRVYRTGRTNATPPIPPAPKSLLNVSTRLRVQAQDDALIGGFIIQGNEPKKVVLRAIGPSLPVADRLPDPALTVYDSGGNVVGSNDNWNSSRRAVLETALAPGDEHEPALVLSLPAGAYTAVVRGANDRTGIGLVELYDVDSVHSRVANISTRGKVESGDNVMIGGFIIGGDQPTKVIVRAIGPSLGAYGVAGALEDPILRLHDGNGSLITQNDDWRSLQEEAIEDSGIPPGDNRECAIIATLQPGNYTAVVSGKDGSSGIGLVEVYNLDSN